jgi:hypothetical protein
MLVQQLIFLKVYLFIPGNDTRDKRYALSHFPQRHFMMGYALARAISQPY